MRKGRLLGFSTFDDKLLDGLDFCQQVYRMFDQIRSAPDGVTNLRLRPTDTEKRLIEELIPLAHYVQARYNQGRRIKVRWRNGSQSYDAILWSSGLLVDRQLVPRRLRVEVTMCMHQSEYLTRLELNQRGGSFGAKKISIEKKTSKRKTRTIVSEPYVYVENEVETDLAGQILERLKKKNDKKYPPGTVLIVNCVPDCLVLASEWNSVIERIREARVPFTFREVFLIESVSGVSATL